MTLKLGLIVVVAALGVVVDLAVDAPMVGRGSIIGVAGTLLLTYGSTWLSKLIKRPEDFYDRHDLPRPRTDEVPPAATGTTTADGPSDGGAHG